MLLQTLIQPKNHKSLLIWLAAILAVLGLFLFSQSPKIISASVSPEVIVKGQDQEITVTAIVKKPALPWVYIRVAIVESGNSQNIYFVQKNFFGQWFNYLKSMDEAHIFTGKKIYLGWLKKNGTDSEGNFTYRNTFTVNLPQVETVQIQLKNIFSSNVFPTQLANRELPFVSTDPTLRLAISTRNFTLVPDPGEAGKATIAGIDSNNNGLRDDLEREIFFDFPESEKIRTVTELSYLARQEQILHPMDAETLSKSILVGLKAENCFSLLSKEKGDQTRKYFRKLVDVLLNTPGRIANSLIADRNTPSNIISSYQSKQTAPEVCDFNWQSLPD